MASSHPIVATPEMIDHEPTDRSNCTCTVPVPEMYTDVIVATSETECTDLIVPTPEMTEEIKTTATSLPQRPPVANNSSSDSTIPTSSLRATPFNPGPFEQAVGPTKTLPSDALPMDFFNLVFWEETYQLIADETNRYARQNPSGEGYYWVDTSKEEIQQFLGILIAMGIHQLPQVEDYWSGNPLLGAPGIVSGMAIRRFKVLLKCLHINNNETT